MLCREGHVKLVNFIFSPKLQLFFSKALLSFLFENRLTLAFAVTISRWLLVVEFVLLQDVVLMGLWLLKFTGISTMVSRQTGGRLEH